MHCLNTRAWAIVLLGGAMAAVIPPRAGDCSAPATSNIFTVEPTITVTGVKGRPSSSGATDGGTTAVVIVPTPPVSTEEGSWTASASEVVSVTASSGTSENFQTAGITGTRIARESRSPQPPVPGHHPLPPWPPKSPGHPSLPGPPPPSLPLPPYGGFRNAIYFTNWGAYAPQQLPVSKLTHVLYAFADIAEDGTVRSSNTTADTGGPGPGNATAEAGPKHTGGNVRQLFLHKMRQRRLKTLLSVGGWEHSPKFAPVASRAERRRTFAASAVALMADYGHDGIDLDWEFPADHQQARDFVLLLQACREALDEYSLRHGLFYRFLLTVASPAGPLNYQIMDLVGMDRYVDSWNLMAYDYSGSWDNTTGHHANLYRNEQDPRATKLNTHQAVQYYRAQGIAPHKITMGIPLYGRSFEATAGLGQAYVGVGSGELQPGVWPYRHLPRPGAREMWDDRAKAPWTYDNATRELISYDSMQSTLVKAQYLRTNGLGGAFYWEASGDKTGPESLVSTVQQTLGWLDGSLNNLWYPTSRFDNIRTGRF